MKPRAAHMKKLFLRVILAAWIIIWVLFLIRPYFKKDILKDYAALFTLSAEGKRAYCLGHDLHRLISFCKGSIAGTFTYRVVGLEKDSIEHRRIRYYLYPNMESADPDFILVYKVKDFSADKYNMFKALDSETYILKKVI